LPRIAKTLNASIDLAQWSMAIYMLGVAISILAYGPISEGFGRKSPISVGLCIMLVGSAMCLFASDIDVLIWGRFVQGCGAGACAGLWRSIFRDVFTGEELAKYGSYLVVFIMFIVPAAPALGGYLQTYFGWRANFIFMGIYTLAALVSILLGFKETSKHHHMERLKLTYIGSTYLELLKSRVFMGVTLCTFLSYGAAFAWFVAGPVLLIKVVGITPIAFGWITFIGGGSAYALAGWINGKLVTRFGMPAMLRFGWSTMILAGLCMLAGKWIYGMTAWSIAAPAILFYFGSTFIWPNAFATAFTPFGKIAGYAGALYGFMQIGGAAVMGGLMSYLPDDTQVPLGLVMLLASFFSWMLYEIVVPKPTISK
jgi:DHA1 family bicyclomycin/chloramphenicol resistance-like MFS transporter/DHA1 family 2-module integral membrane pump EmrD-like MFS transporter